MADFTMDTIGALLSGSGVTLAASTVKYSLAVPVVWNPMTFSSLQSLYIPCVQG